MKTKTRFHKLTAWLLTLAMLMTFIPNFTFTALAADNLCEHHTEHTVECGYVEGVSDCAYHCDVCLGHDHDGEEASEAVCDCGTDDALIHATTCAVYVAPENPVCYCTEKCSDTNIWCDVCGFDYSKCGGTDTAVVYANEWCVVDTEAGTVTIDGTLGGKATAEDSDITALVEQLKTYADNGITTVVVPGTERAMYDSDIGTIPAYAEALFLLANGSTQSPYYGTIDLILPDATEIVDNEFDTNYSIKSITLPKVTTVGDYAFGGCVRLEKLTFGSVVTSINKVYFDPFDGVAKKVDGGLCELVLNCGQLQAETDYQPNCETNVWWSNNVWKSITLTHAEVTAATCTSPATCSVCGEEYGEEDANAHTAEPTYTQNEWDNTQHDAYYSCCDATITEDHHGTPVAVDEIRHKYDCCTMYHTGMEDDGICDVCAFEQYNIIVAPTEHGTVTADKTTAIEGETVTLTVTPADDYELDYLLVNDAYNSDIAVADNKFTMPASNVTVTATFKVKVNYPDGTIIIPLDTNGVPTSISGTGWTYDSGTNTLTLTNGYSYAVDGECEAIVNNSGTIVGGTYNNTVNNVGDGDTTGKEQFGIINGGIFNGAVNNADGLDICTINDGTFNGTVTNKNRGVINNGTFFGEFTEILGSTINGGTFVVEFIANGGTWTTGYTVPTTYTYTDGLVLPTGENISNGSLSFDGWYDNAEFTGLPVTEIPAASSGKQTYYARFVDGIATWEAAGNLAVENTDYTVDADGNYTVLTAKGLAKLANIVNGGDSLAGKTVTLANDINLLDGGVYQYGADTVTERNSWIPIDGFAGTFNGNGKKINDLDILTTNKDAGLFGSNVGTIKELEIASGKVTINVSSGSELHAGGIAATTSGLIDNCINRAEIYSNDTSGSGSVYIGGITGLVSTSTGGAEVSTVSDCTNYGTVSSLGNSNCGISGGGIAGYHFSGRITGRKTLITRCVNEGTISIEPGTGGWAGGIAGTVKSNSNSNTSITATVTNCANKGSVGSNMAGGITGYNTNAAYVYNCYNMGSITGNTNAGGIVGLNYYSNATVANCYSTGSVSTATNIGGIVGKIPSGSISNCYYLSSAATEAYGYKATAATFNDCVAFTSAESTHTLTSAVNETTDLLTALKAWVSEKNVSDYMDWKADAENSNYPVLTEYVVKSYYVTVTNGTGSGEYSEGDTVTITANAPEEGKKFAGWTGLDGLTITEGSASTETVKFTMPAQAVNVTANYELKTYTVSFDAGEGTGTKEPDAGISGEYTLPWITTTSFTAPEEMEFKGWEINGTIYAENAKINVSSDITVTAIWVIPTSIQLQSIDLFASKAVGYQLDQKITRYWKNGDSSEFTGTADDYNAKIEWSVRDGKDVATITLKGANTADTDNTNYGLTVLAANTFDVDIVVEEDSVMDQFSLYSCDVSISGDGKLTIVDPKVDAQNIYVDGNLTLNGANIYAESLEKNAANIIFSTGNLLIDNSTVEIKSGSDWTASAYPDYNFAPLRSNGTMTISNGSDVKVTCIDGTTCHAVMSMEDITIEDSTVTVTNNGTNRGISSEKDIYINGTATVTVNSNGIAIAARNGKLTISGGSVKATSATTYAAIRADEIEISGGSVAATAADTYGIYAEVGDVTISGNANVSAEAKSSAAVYAKGNVTISDNVNIIATSESHTGIIAEKNIEISGSADVEARGKWALWSKANNIAISGGTVEATGSSYAMVSKPVLTSYGNPVVFAGANNTEATLVVDTAATNYHGLNYVRIQPGYIITFDANGGNVTENSVFATDTKGKLSAMPDDPTYAEHNFNGWFDSAEGGNKITTSTVFNANTTVYAQWTEKATASINEAPQTYTYDKTGKAFEIKDTTLTGFTVEYYVEDTWTTVAPTEAGTYDVRITRDEDDTYKAFEKEISGGLVINPVKVEKPARNTRTFTYTGVEMRYNVDASDYYTISNDKRTNAGSQTVTVALKDKVNYTWDDGTTEDVEFEFTIAKANARVMAPPVAAANLVYNGTAQELLTGIIMEFGGQMQFSETEDGPYSPTRIAKADAGDYEVWYKVVGDANHNDTAPVKIPVSIAKKDITNAEVGAFGMTYTGEAQTPAATVTIDGLTVTGTWSDVTNVADKTTFTASGNFTGTIENQDTGMAKADMSAGITASGYNGTYDNASHTINVALSGAADGATVKYGTVDGTYDLDAAPSYTDSGSATVFYQVTKTNYETVTGSATVEIAKKKIDSAISLTAPVKNETPQTEITGTGYTATVVWSPEVTDKFGYNTEYTATVTITTDGNHTVEGIAANGYTVEGAKTVTNEENSNVITVAYEKTGSRPSSGGGSSNTTTTTTKNEDGSTTKTTTNKSTGTTTEVTTNTDGSTTTVETKKDGTVTTTEKDKNGNTTTTVEKPDGTTTTTEKNKDGSETVVEKAADGTTTTTEKDSAGNKTVTTEKADGTTTTEETKKDGTKVTTETNADGETTAQVDAKGETEVVIPVPDAEDVTKVVVTDKDGNETEVEFEVKDGGVAISVSGDSTVSVQTGHTCYAKDFTDVDLDAWYHLDIDYVLENGLMKGTAKDQFAPNDNLTRAMLVTVLYRLEGEPATNRSIPFADIDMGAYYANAVVWAQQNGIVKGVSETEFAPNDNITREQIAAIMHRYAQYKGYDVSVGENTNILSYDDFDSISEYAIASMQYAAGSGLMKGKTTSTLNPLDNATRAEIAAILHRFIEANK